MYEYAARVIRSASHVGARRQRRVMQTFPSAKWILLKNPRLGIPAATLGQKRALVSVRCQAIHFALVFCKLTKLLWLTMLVPIFFPNPAQFKAD